MNIDERVRAFVNGFMMSCLISAVFIDVFDENDDRKLAGVVIMTGFALGVCAIRVHQFFDDRVDHSFKWGLSELVPILIAIGCYLWMFYYIRPFVFPFLLPYATAIDLVMLAMYMTNEYGDLFFENVKRLPDSHSEF